MLQDAWPAGLGRVTLEMALRALRCGLTRGWGGIPRHLLFSAASANWEHALSIHLLGDAPSGAKQKLVGLLAEARGASPECIHYADAAGRLPMGWVGLCCGGKLAHHLSSKATALR